MVLGDAACLPLPREPFRIVANLPFEGATAILRHLLDDPVAPLVRADVIVEWAVAVKRALPWPSTVNDVVWGAWYSTAVTRRLPRRVFEPSPAVDAGVLVFERRACPLVPPELAGSYRRFVAGGFRRGRRSLRAEPRELDAHAWAELFGRRGARAVSGARPAKGRPTTHPCEDAPDRARCEGDHRDREIVEVTDPEPGALGEEERSEDRRVEHAGGREQEDAMTRDRTRHLVEGSRLDLSRASLGFGYLQL